MFSLISYQVHLLFLAIILTCPTIQILSAGSAPVLKADVPVRVSARDRKSVLRGSQPSKIFYEVIKKISSRLELICLITSKEI